MIERISKIIDINYLNEPYLKLNLSKTNTALRKIDFNNPDWFNDYIRREMEIEGVNFAIGKYNEDRIIYDHSNVFDGNERRTIHLGIDFWTTPGTKVFSPYKSFVHSFSNNFHKGDYGPVIILTHNSGGNKFQTLYGHLSTDSLKDLYEGKNIKKGECIGQVGKTDENGNWPPHLHFQVINNMMGFSGDFPGVCSKSDSEKYLEVCPNPNLLLRIPGLN